MSLEIVEWAASWPLVLPYFDGKVPAGFPSPAEDYVEAELDLSEFLVENKAATFMMRVDGDSMKDAGILDGDLLVVDRAAKPVNGSVVVVAVNGEYTVKRLRRGPDCVWLENRTDEDAGEGGQLHREETAAVRRRLRPAF